ALLAGAESTGPLPARTQRAPAQRDAVARLPDGGARRRAPAERAGVRLPAGVPGQYGGADAGQVHAPRGRAGRAPCAGRVAAGVVRAAADRVRRDRPGRRCRRPAAGAVRPVAGTAAAFGLCRAGAPGPQHAVHHLRAGAVRHPAGRPAAGLARVPDRAGPATEEQLRRAMDILPILSTLRRHKLTAWLLILEIALTCAIVCNAVFLIGQRLQRMDMPSGVAEHELLQIQVADVTSPSNPYARLAEDVAVLRQVPGVLSVASSNQVPFGNSSSNGNIRLDPAQPERTLNATTYFGENLVPTLGTRLVSGRDLQPDDFVDVEAALKALGTGDSKSLPHVTLITRTLAERLWPGQNPLGRLIYLTPTVGLRVVGVLDSLARPNA